MHRLRTRADAALVRFSTWFGSAAGVWQTVAVTALIVAFEHLAPKADPNGFLLLYWLTVYSAVTQPALAYAAAAGSARTEALELRIVSLEEQLVSTVGELQASHAEILELLKRAD